MQKATHTLDLNRTKALTDAGLHVLVETGLLHTLAQAGGDGVKRPANLDEIRSLDLVFAPVTDEGLKDLQKCKNLQSLNLGFTQVTDAGLQHLKGCKNLRTLYLEAAPITDAGQKDLEAALPKIMIAH